MSLDLTTVCISYRDPMLVAVVILCTALWCYGAVRLAFVVSRRASHGKKMIPYFVLASVILLVSSPLAVAGLVQGATAVSSRGVVICFHFVRPLLYLPALAGIGSLLVVAMARRRRHRAAA